MVVARLIEAKADLFIKDSRGMTAVDYQRKYPVDFSGIPANFRDQLPDTIPDDIANDPSFPLFIGSETKEPVLDPAFLAGRRVLDNRELNKKFREVNKMMDSKEEQAELKRMTLSHVVDKPTNLKEYLDKRLYLALQARKEKEAARPAERKKDPEPPKTSGSKPPAPNEGVSFFKPSAVGFLRGKSLFP